MVLNSAYAKINITDLFSIFSNNVAAIDFPSFLKIFHSD